MIINVSNFLLIMDVLIISLIYIHISGEDTSRVLHAYTCTVHISPVVPSPQYLPIITLLHPTRFRCLHLPVPTTASLFLEFQERSHIYSYTYAPFQLRLSPWCFDAAMTCSDAFGRFLDALRRFLDAFTRLKTLFGRFLDAFGRFLGAFWTLFGRFLDAFWTILGAFWMLFGRFLDAFWTLFGRF